MVKTIFLFRHGQTDYNVKRLFYGSADVSINAEGQRQAQQLHHLMQEYTIDKVYVSGLKRTWQTASLIFPDKEQIIETDFNEKGFGEWEGLDADDIQAQYPKEWQCWLDAPFDYTPPQAESFNQFKERVITALLHILQTEKVESIAIVAHLGTLRLIYQHLVDEMAVFWDIDFPQGEIYQIEFQEKGWQPVERKG